MIRPLNNRCVENQVGDVAHGQKNNCTITQPTNKKAVYLEPGREFRVCSLLAVGQRLKKSISGGWRPAVVLVVDIVLLSTVVYEQAVFFIYF